MAALATWREKRASRGGLKRLGLLDSIRGYRKSGFGPSVRKINNLSAKNGAWPSQFGWRRHLILKFYYFWQRNLRFLTAAP